MVAVPTSTVGDEAAIPQRKRIVIDATAGAIAGAIARFIVGPLDVVKIRFQVQLEPIGSIGAPPGAPAASKYTGFFQALATILREEGVQVSKQAAQGMHCQRRSTQRS